MATVPKIDRLAGIECYCTSFAGTGGSIKQGSDGFRVSEVADESLAAGISPTFDDRHRYPVYLLEKRDIDSNHALFEIERECRLRLRVMGIKDAKAVTAQYAGADRPMKNPTAELRTTHTHLTLKGFAKRPLGRESLAGNSFEITIHGPRAQDLSGFVPEIERIGNFYGLQRFGSERLVISNPGTMLVNEKLMSAIVEIKVPVERAEAIIRLVWDVEKQLDTVVSIGAGVRCDARGEDPVVAPILERLGYELARAQTNVGLGRRGGAPAAAPSSERQVAHT